MPTRYTLELEGLKGVVSSDTFKEVSQREDAKKSVKKVLEERYTSGKNRWFFTPLSTSFLKVHKLIALEANTHHRVLIGFSQSAGAGRMGSGAVNSIHLGIKIHGSLS